MPDLVVGALITAVGSIVVALIALYQHRAAEREKGERETTERKIEHGEALFGEYRHLLDELRTELARAQVDRDHWHDRAVTAERRVDEWIQSKEK